MNPYRDKIRDLLDNASQYHAAYYAAEIFGGPSLHFHRRALETRKSRGAVAHLEDVYATLASWGMHRMGKGGSKMQPFEIFCDSVEPLRAGIARAQTLVPRTIDEAGWALLEEIFRGLKVMRSGTSLVGNSKAMHHMMPGIVPPIDRQYTLRFLRGNANIANDLDREWHTMKDIIQGFFIPVAISPAFEAKANKWLANATAYPWDTSALKIIDNLLIGSTR